MTSSGIAAIIRRHRRFGSFGDRAAFFVAPMPRPFAQAVLSLAALGNALACCGWEGCARAERLADGTYVIHRGDVPAELKAKHIRVNVEDSVKARLMVPGDRCWILRRGGQWTVEARE